LALADVSGHGAVVDGPAQILRNLMRKYINTLDQTQFAKALNREFARLPDSDRFATALILTYFAPTNHLIVCNAGHCRPLWYRVADRQWRSLDPDCVGECESLRRSNARYHFKRVANLPLGILEPTDYAQFALRLEKGDLVVLYTDGVIESLDQSGRQLGEAGLLELLKELPLGGADQAGENAIAAIEARQAGARPADDRSLMVLRHTGTQPPRLNLGRSVRTLAKMLGLSRV
jgi:serine phosphatase RsbU (regulator of sigma subunit)